MSRDPGRRLVLRKATIRRGEQVQSRWTTGWMVLRPVELAGPLSQKKKVVLFCEVKRGRVICSGGDACGARGREEGGTCGSRKFWWHQ